ncbi:Uncharacterised protein [Vibrio cholerae]|nr:Uncharacterised protein [Vibrio cholerae]CSC16350.1 Uncharacterised protein [Vibrio cholerae]
MGFIFICLNQVLALSRAVPDSGTIKGISFQSGCSFCSSSIKLLIPSGAMTERGISLIVANSMRLGSCSGIAEIAISASSCRILSIACAGSPVSSLNSI